MRARALPVVTAVLAFAVIGAVAGGNGPTSTTTGVAPTGVPTGSPTGGPTGGPTSGPTTQPPTTVPPTTPPPTVPPGCSCRVEVACFKTLSDCQTGVNAFHYDFESGGECLDLHPSRYYFSCTETPTFCRAAEDCLPPPPKCECSSDVTCYATARNCHKQQGGVFLHDHDGSDCSVIHKPVYACSDAPTVCRSTDTCEVIPNGHGNQDPHFRGFDGSEYYFDGEAGQDYNIISDVNLQVNAHFIRLNNLKGTYMGRLGLRFGEHALSFDPHFGVFFNNSLLTNAEVELPEGSFAVETVDGRFRFVFEDDVYHLVVRVAVEKGDREEAYLNIDATLIGAPSDPHGILGQTALRAFAGAAPDSFKVEGEEDDYHVRDGLLGIDFTFNKFVGEPPIPVAVSHGRLRRATNAPLFEAVVY